MKVLIVEDDNVSRRVLEIVLKKMEYEIISVTSGLDAIDVMLESDAPDLILLDWMMPGLDGIEICKKIRKMPNAANKYIVFITTKVTKSDMDYAFISGANAYLNKPFEKIELKNILEEGKKFIQSQKYLSNHRTH